MLLKVRNYELIKDREKTYLTVAVASGGTTLTVRAVDSNAWADNDWIIVGEIGTKNAEILQINGSVSDGTSLTIDNAGSGGARFAHSIDEPVYRIAYNQVEFSHATTESGSKTVMATNELQVDDEYTRYEDIVYTTGYGFVRFVNTHPTPDTYSSYSDAIPYTGYVAKSLGRMLKMVRRLLSNENIRDIDDEDIIEIINEKQRDIAHERLWSFYETIYSDSLVSYKRDYLINSNVVDGKLHSITCQSAPLAKIDTTRFDILHWDSSTTGDPTHFSIWNNYIRLYPLSTSAASTTALNGAISSATATSITVDSTSGFANSGRIIIDSEVISYTHTDSTTFLGCTRGEEGTTATTHTDDTTVTERDIIYSGHKEPTELVDISDETEIPDPMVLVYGACMDLAIGKLSNQVLHDRFKIKYDEGLKRLARKFGKKATSGYFIIKDKDDIVRDVGRFRDPNMFPQNFS